MSYKPIAPAPSGSNHTPPGSSVPSPSLPSSSSFRPAFSDFGPPSMGFVQVTLGCGDQPSEEQIPFPCPPHPLALTTEKTAAHGTLLDFPARQ